MSPRPFNLPAYAIPENAMINFQPVNAALADYTRSQEVAGRSTAQISAANAMARGNWDEAASETARSGDIGAAMAVRRHPMEMQRAQNEERDRETRRLAGALQPIIGMPDGPERAAAWRRLIESDPRWRTALTATGMDPNDHMGTPMAIHAEALGPRDPQALELQRAQTEAARATALHHRYLASPATSNVLDLSNREVVIQGQRPPREIGVQDVERLVGHGTGFRTVSRLTEGFQDSYSMPGTVIGGDIRNWITRNSSGTPGQVAAANWWQDYQRNSELSERNEIFGAALTAHEAAAWRAAAINPNMNPEIIRANLAARQSILSDAMTRRARGLVAAGYDGAALSEMFGIPPAQLGITGEGRRTGGLTPPPGGQLTAEAAQSAVASARQAIARGADRAAVVQRLEAAGIMGHGL